MSQQSLPAEYLPGSMVPVGACPPLFVAQIANEQALPEISDFFVRRHPDLRVKVEILVDPGSAGLGRADGDEIRL